MRGKFKYKNQTKSYISAPQTITTQHSTARKHKHHSIKNNSSSITNNTIAPTDKTASQSSIHSSPNHRTIVVKHWRHNPHPQAHASLHGLHHHSIELCTHITIKPIHHQLMHISQTCFINLLSTCYMHIHDKLRICHANTCQITSNDPTGQRSSYTHLHTQTKSFPPGCIPTPQAPSPSTCACQCYPPTVWTDTPLPVLYAGAPGASFECTSCWIFGRGAWWPSCGPGAVGWLRDRWSPRLHLGRLSARRRPCLRGWDLKGDGGKRGGSIC